MTSKQPDVSGERNESQIFLVRGQKVMLSTHLAEMYEIEPGAMVRTIERNIACFPEGSVFQLKPEEIAGLQSTHAVSGRAAPYAFTGQGVATLSGILFDERATDGNQEACAPTCSCRK
ncbi:MAG: ORF6N domain-containing protein [Betaproteobacteria bacterium]|nr:ORF6N domain-containing protein [Betaproteobacteria bacterium]